MSKTIRVLVAFMATNVLTYLAFAFIALELDPSKWHQDGRVLFVGFGAILGVICALSVKEMK